MPGVQRVVVIGAGVAGLAAARALALRGVQVDVHEAGAPDAAADAGGGLQIAPNGMKVLDALGLGAAARRAGLANTAVALFDGLGGRRITRLDLAPHRAIGLDYLLFHRADLIALLWQGARDAGVGMHSGSRVSVLGADGDGVRLDFGGEARTEALVLAADGFHSTGRAVLNAGSVPFFTGQVAWRAVVPEAPDSSRPTEVEVHLAPGRHLVSYPLRGGACRNIVAVEERDHWAAEGWHHADDPSRLRRAFAGSSARVRDLLARVEAPRLWGLYRHPVAPLWHGGGLALLGDAAHPTLPFLAQGANMALEDAWVLAACLATAPTAEAFARYQALRRPRVLRAIAAANANARNYHLRGPLRLGAHAVLRIGGILAPRAALGRFDWLYRHDVTKM